MAWTFVKTFVTDGSIKTVLGAQGTLEKSPKEK